MSQIMWPIDYIEFSSLSCSGAAEAVIFSSLFHRILQIGINKEVVNLGGELVEGSGNNLELGCQDFLTISFVSNS